MSPPDPLRTETIRYWRKPLLGGIDLLTANCLTHRFARHAHEEAVLAVFERGAEEFETKRRNVTVSAGSVLFIPPGIAHTGRAASPEGWSYRAFYPRPELIHDVSASIARSKIQLRRLPLGVITERPLFDDLLRAHRLLASTDSALDQTAVLIGALERLLPYITPDSARGLPAGESKAVTMARDFIDANYADPIDGSEIAAAVGLSVPHLMRAFFATMGVPMNVYLTSVRLSHARKLLLDGENAASVALQVGFVDQSHLIRRFRNALGVTPGQYVRDSAAPSRPMARR